MRSLAPDLVYEEDEGMPNVGMLIPQVTTYLNAGGAAMALPDYFAGVEPGDSEFLALMTSDVVAINMDADADEELVIAISVVHNASWNASVLLYDCVDGVYSLLGEERIDGRTYRLTGLRILEVADFSGNGQPEIYLQRDDGMRIKGHEVLVWDGTRFANLEWMLNGADDPQPAVFGHILSFPDLDGDGSVEARMSFQMDGRDRLFAYDEIYDLRDAGFDFRCQIYLGDEPTFPAGDTRMLIAVVEEADSTFNCGYDELAEALFRQVVTDESLRTFEFEGAAMFRERDNLRAFSLYRLVLIAGRRGDGEAVEQAYRELESMYPVEVPGSNYTSMAEAFWLEFRKAGDWDAACAAVNDYIEPYLAQIREMDPNERRRNGLYVSPYAGYPAHRPNSLYRGCPDIHR